MRKQKQRKQKTYGGQKQLLLDDKFKVEKEFGGAHLKKSHAKKARPIPIKKAMHLTLRSSKAKGDKSFRYNKIRIERIEAVVRAQAKKFGVEIFRYANVGNHLHMLVQASYRRGFISFLRAISGIIARITLGAERGMAKFKEATNRKTDRLKEEAGRKEADKLKGVANKEAAKLNRLKEANTFWDQRPWTRVLLTWTEFKNVKKYVEQNFNEAMGFVPYKSRKYRSTA